MKNSIIAEAFQKWLSCHLIFFFSFIWVMSHDCLICLCFKGCLVLSFRNTFPAIRILAEERRKWQSDY